MLPKTTRAAVLAAHGAPLEMTDLPLPDVIEPGAALVRLQCSTLCGTDIEIWSGKMSFPGMLPMVLGHEMVGEIIGLGQGTHDALGRPLKIGDRIGWSESTCGHCHGCSILREPVACSSRGYGFLQRSDRPPYAISGLSQYAYVTPGAQKLVIPPAVKDTWAAMAGCTAKTVLRAFERAGNLRTGAKVVVQGAGALGIFATAAARLSGAGTVITVGAPDSRLAMAKRFGADHTVDIAAGSEGIVEAVLAHTDGQGADYIFDFAGAPSIGREAVGMAAQRGKIIVVGSTDHAENPLSLGRVMGKELTFHGSLNGDIADYKRALDFFCDFGSRMPWDELFSAPVGLSKAHEAILQMQAQGIVKAVIDPRLS